MVLSLVANLGGQLTPEIIDSINGQATIGIVANFVMIAIIFVISFSVFSWIFGKIFTRSGDYRKLLVDMYVVGMIKKFAKEDSIDLISELKEFNKIERKKSFRNSDIDEVIAENLKEKVNAKAEKDIERIEEIDK